jgi:hypothetical protein
VRAVTDFCDCNHTVWDGVLQFTQAGKRIPHPRHWQALAELAKVVNWNYESP